MIAAAAERPIIIRDSIPAIGTPMPNPLREDLDRLKVELDRLPATDTALRERLAAVVFDLEVQLGERVAAADGGDPRPGIRDAVTQFEASHPRATGILNDILVALGNMGI